MISETKDGATRHWKRWLLLIWLLVAAALIAYKWPSIHFFILSDTDDNMRIAQVRAWLDGQGWSDLRQYKLDPPQGADIHWSRLVDLPLAAIIVLVKPFFGTMVAEKAAIAIAPLLPLGLAMLGAALTARRLIDRNAWALAAALMICAPAALNMFGPTRIDHHGWQIAFLALAIAGLTDPQRARGGLTVGLATAGSLVIGLEMLPYLAISGAAVTLGWIWDRNDARRLRAYGLSLGGGTALGFAAFASQANFAARCDALSPVWLSVMVLAGALLFALSFAAVERRELRLALAGVAGALVGAAILIFWPHCLGRPEGISPELERLWFNNIREVKPLYSQQWKVILPTIALPIVGVIGSLWALRRAWGGPRFGVWLPIALFSVTSAILLLWQTRAGPAAQLVAIPGAAALGWTILPRLARSGSVLVRTAGVVGAFLVISGLAVSIGAAYAPVDPPSPGLTRTNKVNAACMAQSSMKSLGKLPAATMFTHVDLAPRLIVLTHHRAIAGPYHRNGDAILDVIHFFGRDPGNARRIAAKHGATMLLMCPGMPETTVYRSRDKTGFYVQLMQGKVPAWLEPVPLPANSPFKLWRIVP